MIEELKGRSKHIRTGNENDRPGLYTFSILSIFIA